VDSRVFIIYLVVLSQIVKNYVIFFWSQMLLEVFDKVTV